LLPSQETPEMFPYNVWNDRLILMSGMCFSFCPFGGNKSIAVFRGIFRGWKYVQSILIAFICFREQIDNCLGIKSPCDSFLMPTPDTHSFWPDFFIVHIFKSELLALGYIFSPFSLPLRYRFPGCSFYSLSESPVYTFL
jgi:hypothetical protein